MSRFIKVKHKALLKWLSLPVGGTVVVFAYQFTHPKIDKERTPKHAEDWQVRCYRTLPLKNLSAAWGWINSVNIPVMLRVPLLSLYVRAFNCDLSEAEVNDLKEYRNLGEFFRRDLKCGCRPIHDSSPIVIPADGLVLHHGQVEDGIDEVKGVYYSLEQFLGPPTWDQGLNPSEDNYVDFSSQILRHKDGSTCLFHCVIYLAPGDYHKFHSPCEWKLKFRRHFCGELLSVNPRIVKAISGLFSLNERAVYIGEWEHGFFSFAAVGATNVGSIKIYNDPDLLTNGKKQQKGLFQDIIFEKPLVIAKGEKFGEFNLGSTIVILFEAPLNFKFKELQYCTKVRVGETLISKIDPPM